MMERDKYMQPLIIAYLDVGEMKSYTVSRVFMVKLMICCENNFLMITF